MDRCDPLDELPRIFGTHECRSDEDRVDARRQHPRIVDGGDPGFGDKYLIRVHERMQLPDAPNVDVCGVPQVPGVDADNPSRFVTDTRCRSSESSSASAMSRTASAPAARAS